MTGVRGRAVGALLGAGLLAWAACGGSGGEGRAPEAAETPAAGAVPESGSARTQDAAGAPSGPEEVTPAAAPATGRAAAETVAVTSPGAASTEDPRLRQWVLIVLARPATEADLAWIRENGIVVDTVMDGVNVRGWLRGTPAPDFGRDPRIARIVPLMR
jgi:hypothetical protein